ncbi:hypothetical protein ACP1HW_004570 [Klebsiella pneumoniae]|nr:hypothetical protein [Klebsiella pneumoniae]HBR4373014.1 hypothetical protein [Klebsiella pneumoniae]HCK6997437.1 hypothetical protein [Klebsiella pneumoniae]HCK7008747.1 hypothetical protein [Klebsiella pneumoniae]HDT4525451.1 hypothetical protein [Klebsiella pneumoniae subsp. pneumoniae]
MITLLQYDNGYYALYVDDHVRIETPYLFETRDEIELMIETRDGTKREIEWHIDHIPEDEEYYHEIDSLRNVILKALST